MKDVEGLQRTLLAALRQRGIVIQRKFVFTRVLDGFSAELDARAVAELDRIAVVGGVAANSELRSSLPGAALAPLELCTDNAAMIASAGRFAAVVPYPEYLALDAYATAA